MRKLFKNMKSRTISSSATATALIDDDKETNPANEEEVVIMQVGIVKAKEELTAQGLSYNLTTTSCTMCTSCTIIYPNNIDKYIK